MSRRKPRRQLRHNPNTTTAHRHMQTSRTAANFARATRRVVLPVEEREATPEDIDRILRRGE